MVLSTPKRNRKAESPTPTHAIGQNTVAPSTEVRPTDPTQGAAEGTAGAPILKTEAEGIQADGKTVAPVGGNAAAITLENEVPPTQTPVPGTRRHAPVAAAAIRQRGRVLNSPRTARKKPNVQEIKIRQGLLK